ncbi:hypothetical protein ACEZCY_04925 [Streptacidiphilus sp. N1-12]|uniref:Uncharacterized protein n=2 Tax=Streptacidiphilus alkalitolerans TaxID=3342712 RepID=A0ABV6W941_9ACTN
MATSLQDRPRFAVLSSLLSAPEEVTALELWDIGEQENAIVGLVDTLLHERVRLTERSRVQLAVLAETWGVWDSVGDRIGECEAADEENPPWWLVRPGRAEMIGGELVREIEQGHVLHGLELVVWLECGQCDDVLVRAYPRGPWGPSFLASLYAVVHPTWRGSAESPSLPETSVFPTAEEALGALNACR